mmetsp:Transcript_34509/g.87075  ORF Transcript_34509/g.87075 Transcript_34509/m.87075 type:complete len:313 (-) Transcript_34509:292-1230(-)
MAELKRGPKIGDSASLWNFTPSPGWTKEEAQILKLCLMKHGVGRWVQILDSGLLPGKLIQQLNGQTQRLLGQQSLAAYTGLQVDIDRIRSDNNEKSDVERKSGLIIRSGKNPTKEMRDQWQKDAQERYGLTPEQLHEVDVKLQEAASEMSAVGGTGQTRQDISAPVISIMDTDPVQLNKHQKLQLLKRLRQRLEVLHATSRTSQEGAYVSNTVPLHSKADAQSRPGTAEGKLGKRQEKRPAGVQVQKTLDLKRRKGKPSRGHEDDGYVKPPAGDTIQQLMGMGFARSKCLDALKECDGTLELAIEFLFSNCV